MSRSATPPVIERLGFASGFTCLFGLPEDLRMPRRADPRRRVPPGSVGIGGIQACIHPPQLPGG